MKFGQLEAMPRPFHSTYWKAVLPDGWQARNLFRRANGEIDLIWHPEGVGQLNIHTNTAFGPPSRNNTTFQPYVSGLSGYYRQNKSSACFSRSWILLCEDRWLSARYTCWTETYDWELAAVDAIIQNITTTAQGD